MTLDELRRKLDGLDRQLLQIIAERQTTSRQIAEVKRATGYPTRDYRREREVILSAREGDSSTRASASDTSPPVPLPAMLRRYHFWG